ncbi:hypothetical protein RUND412_006896 [Rhizina undulata]
MHSYVLPGVSYSNLHRRWPINPFSLSYLPGALRNGEENPLIASLVEEYRTVMSGVKVQEDRLKEPQYGDLDMAELFEVEYDNGSIIVEDDQADEDDTEVEAADDRINEFQMVMLVPWHHRNMHS